jgi:TolA-binding protein
MTTRIGTSAWILAISVAASTWLAGGEALAQRPGQGQGSRPFESTYRRPNVSPYLQLQEQGFNPLQTQNIYQTQVIPRLEQQRQQIEQLNQRRQMGQMQNQMRQIQQSSQARQFDETIRPTGHASTYMNYSHYYPQQR